jgi:DNA-binding transcriptional regulator GbsR (MarR family)
MSSRSHASLSAEVRGAERLAGALVDSGMARMPARVLAAAILDEDGRMTAAEIADFLDVSAASVSGAVRMLSQLGLLRRERQRGSRRDVYIVEDDVWRDATARYDQIYAPIMAAMSTVSQELGPDHAASRRLVLAHEFLAFVQDEFKQILDRWDERKHQLGLD